MAEVLFHVAILKGIIEHNDGTTYFGSMMGYKYHEDVAITEGLISNDGKSPTKHGLAMYDEWQLVKLPNKGRAYMWDWSIANCKQEANK